MNSPLVHAALRELFQDYERIFVGGKSLADMDDEEAFEWVCALLRRKVLDGEEVYRYPRET